MSEFTQRIAGLEVTFPQSGLSPHEPGMLTDYVQLVHPVFGPLQRIGKNERQVNLAAAAAGVTTLVLTTAPAGRVRVVEFAEAQHDDVAARRIDYQIIPAGAAGNVTTIQSTISEGGGAAHGSLVPFALKRPVALGPGDSLRVFVAVAAGFIIDGRVVFIDYTAVDTPAGL